MLRRRLLAGLLLFLAFPCVLKAQPIPESAQPLDREEQRKALDMLEGVAAGISNLRCPENRLVLKYQVADLIWNEDEKRGRVLFLEISREMAGIISSIDARDNQAYNNYYWLFNLRQEMLGRLAGRDPEMALNVLRNTRLGVPSSVFTPTMERNLELSLARAMARKEPDQALRLAAESLAKGLSNEVTGLLYDLQQQKAPAAQSFYQTVVSRIKEEDLVENNEAANVAFSVLNSFSPPIVSENSYRELLETVIKAALLTNPNDSQQAHNFYNFLRSLTKQVETYAPGRQQALRSWSEGIERTLDSGSRMQNELQLAYQNGTIDDLIALATKHPAEMRNQIYQQAAWKATNVGDTARANQIAMELISDEAQRRQLLEQVRNQKIWQALNENRIDEAKALLDDSIGVEQKVYILMQLASMLSGKDKQREAIACLDEGLALLQTVPRNSSRMNREIELAGSYSLVDPKQSFALLESIAKQLNELVVAAVVVDGFDNTYLKNGEWMVNGSSSLANIFTSMRRSVGQFAGVDFDQAQVLAAQFERPEMRLMAQLEVARTVLVQQKVNVGVRGRYRVWRN